MNSSTPEIKSHVDLTTFIRFINIKSDVPVDAADHQALLEHYYGDLKTNSLVHFHELYHYWQGLRYPFFFWQAFLSTVISMRAVKDLATQGGDFREWRAYSPALDSWNQVVQVLVAKTGDVVVINDNDSLDEDAQSLIQHSVRLSIRDLAEATASLVEWQSSNIAEARLVDVRSFERWCKRHNSYTKVYSFLKYLLQDSTLALRTLAPLVEVSFRTTKPIEACLKILSQLKRMQSTTDGIGWLAQPEPCRWIELFELFLSRTDAEEFDPGNFEKFSLLPLERIVDLNLEGGYSHPFLQKHALEWRELERQEPSFGLVMSQLPWTKTEVLKRCFEDFEPLVSAVRVSDLSGVSKSFLLGKVDDSIAFGGGKGGVRFVFLINSLFRGASQSSAAQAGRLCSHTGCPEFANNMCSMYVPIPSNYSDCKFTSDVEELIQIYKEQKNEL